MITSPGIGSGLDINSLVTRLVAAQGQPATVRLAQREAAAQGEISSFGRVQSALSALGDAVAALRSLSTYDARTATSGDSDLFTASAADSAAVASYGIEVVALAKAHKLVSGGFADSAASVGSGSLTLGAGAKSVTIAIAPGNDSLAEVRDAINAVSAEAGLTATIITVDQGGGGKQSKLLLTANETGAVNAITVTVDDDDLDDADVSGLSRLVYDPAPGSGVTNLSEAQPAADAQIEVDGQTVSQSGNVITGAIEGVTLTLAKAEPGITVDLVIARHSQAVTDAVEAFVDAFNELHGTIAELTRFDAETGARGALLGDPAMLAISSRVRRELTDVVVGASGPSTLSEIGIRTQLDGTLSLDSAVFQSALGDDPQGVAALFSSSDGIATRLDGVVQGLLDADGTIEARLDSLNARLEDISEQREDLDRSLAALEARLFAQFNAMDALVAELSATSNFLVQQLSLVQSFTVSNQTR